MGLSIADIDALDIGFLYDMMSERARDDEDFDVIATQEDFDAFRR